MAVKSCEANMEVMGTCRKCTEVFDAHWKFGEVFVDPVCPICKSPDVYIRTDETFVGVEFEEDGEE